MPLKTRFVSVVQGVFRGGLEEVGEAHGADEFSGSVVSKSTLK